MSTTMTTLINHLREAWSTPKRTSDSDLSSPDLDVVCSFSDGGVEHLPSGLPPDLTEFWGACESARLFEDRKYGQWGLVLLSPQESTERSDVFRERRTRDYLLGDRIVGEFLGDSDLLLVRSDPESSDFGNVVVALPIDAREDWYVVARSFTEFLNKYAEAEGNKYWE